MNKESELLQDILNRHEDEGFECKRSSAPPRKLLEAVTALANTRGGLLVIGLEDMSKETGIKRLIGINENTDNLSEFYKLLEKDIHPQIIYRRTEIGITNIKGCQDALVVIDVEKSSEIHSLNSGDTFIRRHSQSVRIGAQEIVRLQHEKGLSKFEEEKTRITTLDVLDDNLLKKYKDDVGSREQNPWQFLKDNGLAEEHDDTFYMTRAGALLFCKDPSISLRSKCEIKISHYYGTQRVYSGEPNSVHPPFSVKGPLLYQIQKTVDYFQEVVHRTSSQKLQGATFNSSSSLIIPK